MAIEPSPTGDPARVIERGIARGTVRPPGSKSHAIRALICACLADGVSRIDGLPDGGDVRNTVHALRALGFSIRSESGDTVLVEGTGGFLRRDSAEIFVGGSGTALRLLTAVCALGPGPYTIDGDASLRRRPLGSIGDALEQLGIGVKTRSGKAPVIVRGGPPPAGEVRVDAGESSQPLSAMMLLRPAVRGLTVHAQDVVSIPYVRFTEWVCRRFGVEIWERNGDVPVPPGDTWIGPYVPRDESIVGDWSSAAFLLALGPATGGAVTVAGLEGASPQADRLVEELLRRFGADVTLREAAAESSGHLTRPLSVDLREAPDLAPLTGALACLVEGETIVSGAAHLRIKESDRIAAVVLAARALGCHAEEREDGFQIRGPARHGGTIDPQGDHRIAMAFAVAGAAIGDVRILDPGCVAKSFPGFWDAFDLLLSGPRP